MPEKRWLALTSFLIALLPRSSKSLAVSKCPSKHARRRGALPLTFSQSSGTPASRYNVYSDDAPSAAASSNPASLTSRPASRSARTLRPRVFADTSRQTRPPTDTSNPSTHSFGSARMAFSFSACKRLGRILSGSRPQEALTPLPSAPAKCGTLPQPPRPPSVLPDTP